MRKKLALLGAIFGAGAVLYSCGGGGGGTAEPVSLYITDLPGNQYAIFEVTIYDVNLCRDTACTDKVTLFSDPAGVTIDLTNLNGVLWYGGSSTLQAGTYQGFEVVVDQNVQVGNGTPTQAQFTDYTSPDGTNTVTCDATAQRCSIVYVGNVDVTPGGKVIIDFNLSNFQVDETTTPWTISQVNVVPQADPTQNQNQNQYQYRFEMYAIVQGIDTANNSMTVQWRGDTYTIDISNVYECEVGNAYYNGDPAGCLNALAQIQNACVELKVSGDPATSNQLQALEVETKKGSKCGQAGYYEDDYSDDYDDYYYQELKGIVTQKSDNGFELNGTRINITDTTVCEYMDDVYYMGQDCYDNLQEGWFVEVKVDPNGNAIKIEHEYDD